MRGAIPPHPQYVSMVWCIVKHSTILPFTYLTACSRILLINLTATQLVYTFPAVYGTRRFITVFIKARHWSLSWARCIQSKHFQHISLRSILILSSHLRLVFRVTSSLQVFRKKKNSHACYMTRLSRPPWLDHPNNIWCSVQVMKLLIMQPLATFSLSGPNIPLSTQCKSIHTATNYMQPVDCSNLQSEMQNEW
jgi:hypothetical protein